MLNWIETYFGYTAVGIEGFTFTIIRVRDYPHVCQLRVEDGPDGEDWRGPRQSLEECMADAEMIHSDHVALLVTGGPRPDGVDEMDEKYGYN